MPKRRGGRKIYFETVLTKTTKDVVVECVIDCCEHSEEHEDYFAHLHKEFVEAIEKNIKCTGGKKKDKKKSKKLEAEKILGTVMSDGELMFMIKWKEKDEIALINAQQATQKYPKLVKFYFARRLQWSPIHDKQTYKMIDRPKI